MEKINNVVKSPIAPKTTNAIWINTEDNTINVFNEHQGWIKIGGGDVKPWKPDIVLAINEMGGYADESMTIGQLANAIRDLNLVQLGELEYNIPIESVEQALNLASINCTKFVDDYTVNMYTPLIVDEWQAVEEVHYKKLLNYNFSLFSSDERKDNVYALTLCHSLKSVVFDALRSISLSTAADFCSNNIVQESFVAPSLISISTSGGKATKNIGHNLQALKLLDLSGLKTISSTITHNVMNCFTYLYGLKTLDLESLSEILFYTESPEANIFTGLRNLEVLSLPSLMSIFHNEYSENTANIFTELTNVKSIIAPLVTVLYIRRGNIFSGTTNLEYIEIGHTGANGGSITGNTKVSINPTNTYEDAEKLAALNASIREHWFANLHDYTGGTAHTLTLPTAFVQHMEQSTKDVAAAKNWTLVTF